MRDGLPRARRHSVDRPSVGGGTGGDGCRSVASLNSVRHALTLLVVSIAISGSTLNTFITL